jgi:hypothetical protein
MHIVFSKAYEKCLASFIDKLEGDDRPMDLTPSDFLKRSVEAVLKRFFRVVRSVKTSAAQESLGSPIKCATFLGKRFGQLGEELTDHPTMMRLEAVYRLREVRRVEAAAVVMAEPKKSDAKAVSEKGKVQWSDVSPEDEKKAGPRKTCTGLLGSQIGAVRKDGRPYSCGRGVARIGSKFPDPRPWTWNPDPTHQSTQHTPHSSDPTRYTSHSSVVSWLSITTSCIVDILALSCLSS